MRKYFDGMSTPTLLLCIVLFVAIYALIVLVQGLFARWVIGMFWTDAYAYSAWAYGLAIGLFQSIFKASQSRAKEYA